MIKPTVDFKAAFEALPGAFLVLQPNAPNYTILAVSEEYLFISGREKKALVGKSVFEVFPENPEAPSSTGPTTLRNSLDRAVSKKEKDQMPLVRYDVRNENELFEERFWTAVNTPVLDSQGEVSVVIHMPREVTAKVMAEKKQRGLREIEKKYKLFMEAPVALFIVSGPQNTFELANEEMLRVLNRTAAIIGQPLLDALPEVKKQKFPALLEQVRKTGESFAATEYPAHILIDGKEEERFFNFVYQPYFDREDNKVPAGVVCVAHDVSEQVIARKQLEESEHRFKNLIAESPIPTCLFTGKDFVAEIANDPMIEIWGKGAVAIGKPLKEILPELEDQPYLQLLEKVFTTAVPYEAKAAETRLLRGGVADIFYFDFSYKPLFNMAGEVYGVMAVAVDVTEQVRVQKQLTDQKEYLQNAIDIAELGTFKVDVASNTGSYSNRVKEWFGLENLNQPMEVVFGKIHAEDRQMVLQAISGSLESADQSRHDIGYRLQPFKDGSIRHLRSIGKALFAEDETPYSIIGIIQDVTPQLSAHQKLEESELRFRNMVEQAPVAITLTRGKELVIEVINSPMLQIIGKERKEEVLGTKMIQALPEVAGQPVLAIVEQVMESGKSFVGSEVQVGLWRKGKYQEHYFNLSYTPLFDNGQVTSIIHVAIDVTEQVEARKNIEEGSKQLNELANAMPQVVWIAEPNGEVTYYNDRVSAFEGVQKLADGSWTWQLMLHPEDEKSTVEEWGRAVREGFIYQKEHRLQMKDGTFRWHLSRAFPQRDDKGNILKWFGTATDVHEQKASEEALRRSEEQLRLTVEGAEIGTFYFYPQEGELFWSVKTKELMGLPPDAEVNPDAFIKAVHPDDRERCARIVQEAVQPENGGSYENEFRIVRFSDGKTRWLRSKGKVSFDEQENPIRFTGVTQDISPRKESEEALESTNKQLLRINNDLDNFIYTASHDLKAPITNIEGLMQLLLRNLPDEILETERVQRIAGMMEESVERFKKTIANLTEVVKLQKEHSGEKVSIDLGVVIREVQLDLEPMIEAADAVVEIDAENCQSIRFSEKNLRSVVYNLLSNAIKYRSSDRKPIVQIHCESTNAYDVLSVKDNGLGMAEDRLGQLFTMFKRFHAHVEGTGIGLYMVKKMVENAGGHIKVESQLGEGSVFRVYFPH